MAMPSVTIEVGFDAAGPLDDTFTWTDVTSDFRSFTTERGKQHELDRVEAGKAVVVLDNTDRQYDPTNASGPYAPNVVPMKPIRIRATHNAVTYDIFRGFVEAWGLDYSRKFDATVAVECVDAFKVLSLVQTKNYQDAVLEDEPVAYWPLDDDGTTGYAADIGSGDPARAYNRTGAIFNNGSSPFTYGSPNTLLLDETGNQKLDAGTPDKIGDLNETLSVEFWVRRDAQPIEWVISPNDGFDIFYDTGAIQLEASTTTVGGIACGGGDLAETTSGTDATTWFHVVVVRDFEAAEIRIYVNASLVETEYMGPCALSSGYVAGRRLYIGADPSDLDISFDGRLAHVAIYDKVLDADRIQEHYDRRTIDAMGALRTDQAIGELLDLAGWPASLRNLDTGKVTLSPKYRPSEDVLTECHRVADSEGGLFYATPDGKLRFVHRDALYDGDAVQAVFGDRPDLGEVMYTSIDVAYDDSDLITRVIATGADGVLRVADDATAQTSYGIKTLDLGELAIHDRIDVEERLY